MFLEDAAVSGIVIDVCIFMDFIGVNKVCLFPYPAVEVCGTFRVYSAELWTF
jgi:hypothetical protein